MWGSRDATPDPDLERQTRARVWRFVFDCYEKRVAKAGNTADGAKSPEDDPTQGHAHV